MAVHMIFLLASQFGFCLEDYMILDSAFSPWGAYSALRIFGHQEASLSKIPALLASKEKFTRLSTHVIDSSHETDYPTTG